MNENIDLTKILNGCPNGTKLYTPMFGYVFFDRIESGYVFCERRYGSDTVTFCIPSDGKYDNSKDAEIVIFPSKEQRDWSKFERFWDKPNVERFDPRTFQPFDKILVRDKNTQPWSIDFYSFYDTNFCDGMYPIVTPAGRYRYAIPYNEDTKHLVGSNDCPEYYKWWEE